MTMLICSLLSVEKQAELTTTVSLLEIGHENSLKRHRCLYVCCCSWQGYALSTDLRCQSTTLHCWSIGRSRNSRPIAFTRTWAESWSTFCIWCEVQPCMAPSVDCALQLFVYQSLPTTVNSCLLMAQRDWSIAQTRRQHVTTIFTVYLKSSRCLQLTCCSCAEIQQQQLVHWQCLAASDQFVLRYHKI